MHLMRTSKAICDVSFKIIIAFLVLCAVVTAMLLKMRVLSVMVL